MNEAPLIMVAAVMAAVAIMLIGSGIIAIMGVVDEQRAYVRRVEAIYDVECVRDGWLGPIVCEDAPVE